INPEISAASAAPFVADLVTERIISALGPQDAGKTAHPDESMCEEERIPHISNDVEYALHCLLFLGGRSGFPAAMSVRDLAEFQGIPAEHLQRIFDKLRKAEIVAVLEGSGAKFVLARPPEQIRYLDIIVAIDGRRPLFECTNLRFRCAL